MYAVSECLSGCEYDIYMFLFGAAENCLRTLSGPGGGTGLVTGRLASLIRPSPGAARASLVLAGGDRKELFVIDPLCRP